MFTINANVIRMPLLVMSNNCYMKKKICHANNFLSCSKGLYTNLQKLNMTKIIRLYKNVLNNEISKTVLEKKGTN